MYCLVVLSKQKTTKPKIESLTRLETNNTFLHRTTLALKHTVRTHMQTDQVQR